MDESIAMCHFAVDPKENKLINVKKLEPFNDIEALELSIAKWQTIINTIEAGYEVGSDGGTSTCGLCVRHLGDASGPSPCDQNGMCPVKRMSGQVHCACTPYNKWVTAKNNEDDEDKLDAAYQEVEFLQNILNLLRTVEEYRS